MERNKIILTEEVHCHSIYSRNRHGKSTIEENVQAAIEKNISRITITDHGFGHTIYGVKRKKMEEIRREIDRLNKVYDEIEILLGIEANVIGYDGTIDVKKEEFALFDRVNVGWHNGVGFKDARSYYIYHFLNKLANANPGKYHYVVEYNTDAMIRAIEENNIFMITHPGDKIQMNMDRLAKACEKTDTKLEINNHHPHLSVDEIRTCMAYDVTFTVGSDAHHKRDIGNVEYAIDRVIQADLSIDRVYNLKIKDE